jgi:hypothetical protein
MVKFVMATADVPEFVKVAFFIALWPFFTVPNPSDLGDDDNAESPVPFRGTVCGPPVTLSVTVKLAVSFPSMVVDWITVIVQVAFTARLVQVFVSV